jgi:hypothetical protein
MRGIVKSFGSKAISIQTGDKKQYYAPYCDVADQVIKCLVPRLRVPVLFKVDTTRVAGVTSFGKRYYATHVVLQDVVVELTL